MTIKKNNGAMHYLQLLGAHLKARLALRFDRANYPHGFIG